MIKIPYEQLLDKIQTEKGIKKEEIEVQIKAKIAQLSGLISQEGAAHILANELGVNIGAPEGKVTIKQLLAGMRNVTLVGKLLKMFDIREFDTGARKGKVGSFIIGDETGTIRVTCWNDQTTMMEKLKVDDIVQVENCFVRENRGSLEIHINDKSIIKQNPEGLQIAEIKQDAIQTLTRKNIVDLQESDINVEILGTIVQIFDIKFFERQNNVISYVTNVYLDDGTGNIRVAFFTNQLQHLLKKTDEEIKIYQTSPEQFQNIKTDLLGEMIKITGRVKKNAMYDKMEFVASYVDTDVNPEEEIQRLREELEQ